MLFNDIKSLWIGILVYTLVTMACAWCAYYTDAKRSEDDPKKRKYHPLGILFAPIALPFLLLFFFSIFILRVLTYGIMLILFPLALIFIHKPFIITWLQKVATRIGEALLQANTFVMSLFLRSFADQPERIKIPASQGSL